MKKLLVLLVLITTLAFADTTNVLYHTYYGTSGPVANVVTGLGNFKYQIVLAGDCTDDDELEFKIYTVGASSADPIILNANHPILNIDATQVDKITVKANTNTPKYSVYIFRVLLNQGNTV